MDLPDFKKRVGRRLRHARLAAAITIDELADEAMSFRLISEFERGKGNPRLASLFRLASKLDVSVAELLDVEPKRTGRTPLMEREAEPLKRGPRPKKKRLPPRGRK